jgi:hypothetical protein
MDIGRGFRILIKKTNYITRLKNREMNLLSLIKPSLAHVCTVALKANHGLIMLPETNLLSLSKQSLAHVCYCST